MAQGSLRVRVTDLAGDPVGGQLTIDFEPAGNSPGGASMEAVFALAGSTGRGRRAC